MFYFIIFILGISVGSFLNVVIFRLETGEPIIVGRSHCRQCGAVLRWYDLIPLVSFILTFGKCRYCGKKINFQYPMVEIATGLLFLFVAQQHVILSVSEESRAITTGFFALLRMTDFVNLFYYLIITSFLIIIFVYDLRHYIIPDKIVYPAILVSGIWYLVSGIFIQNTKYEILNTTLAAFGASAFFLALVFISKGRWMGMGDVKLAFLMGLVLGWPNILIALFLAFLFGAIIGVALIVFGKKGLKSQIPFGPFLAGSTILIMLCGQYSADWIEKLFFF